MPLLHAASFMLGSDIAATPGRKNGWGGGKTLAEDLGGLDLIPGSEADLLSGPVALYPHVSEVRALGLCH